MATAKGSLPIGGSINDALQTSGEQDLFTVGLITGYNYQFILSAAASFTTNPGNLYETLIGPNNVTVPNSQLSAGGNTSRSISITPTTSGTYTLSIANNANATGAYTLEATPQDDNGTTPRPLTIGSSTAGVLESAGDTDTFTVGLLAGYNYQFLLTAAASFTANPGNLYETLIGPNNVVVPNSQLSAGGNTSRSISITPTTSGTYTLSIANNANATGAYTLEATPQDDDGTTPRPLTIGSSTAGVLESAGDTDTFTVGLVAGYNYQFILAAAASFTANPGNLYETLIGPNNVVVPNSQLSAGGNTSRSISITPTTSGTYTLSIANNANATGAYTLAATPQDDDGRTPRPITIGGSTAGVLESAGDTDTFTVGLLAGSNYQFILTAAANFTTNPGSLYETLIGPNNVVVPNNQLSAGGNTSRSISITPTTSGTYTLSIANNANAIGTYTINAITVPTTPMPTYRFFDTNYGTHFFTSDAGERNTILATRSDLTEETNGFGDVAQSDPNAVAVFRFFDKNYGTHFFTASGSERDTIIAGRPDLGYESSSTFYEHLTQQSGDVAVYRLFDQKTGTQFLTGDSTEYNGITSPGAATYRSDLRSEGVAFYAPIGTFK